MIEMRTLTATVLGGFLLAGCATAEEQRDRQAAPSPSPSASASAGPDPATPGPDPAGFDPAAVAANELGAIPVLMYHQISPNSKRMYDLTPEAFRAQLQQLYDAKYRPITAAALASGRIDVPAGTSPVVLTFDDSTHDQARIGVDGSPTPSSALGILEAFEREHPEFTATATFYVNSTPQPFTDPAVLPWLVANGYEVGAHTHSHADLSKLDDAGVQAEIGRDVEYLEKTLPGYRVTTFAVPFGVYPRNVSLARGGTHDGVPYSLEAVFGVAEISSPSPFSARWDPNRIPRLDTGQGVGDAQDALDRLKADPTLRYVSDGNPARISFPADRTDRLSPIYASSANPF